MGEKGKLIFGIDFDGTCTTHAFPEIGIDIGAVPVLKRLVENGHKLILFTMRCDSSERMWLSEAVNWFDRNDIPLYGIQTNPTQLEWTTSPKAYCNVYIDDAALGCPLQFDPKISDRYFVWWEQVEDLLKQKGYIY